MSRIAFNLSSGSGSLRRLSDWAGRLTLLVTVAFCVSACRLQIVVPDGGRVQAAGSSVVLCTSQTTCVIEVTDTSFTASFTAEPEQGWVFLNWSSGEDFLCPGETNPVCSQSNVLLTGNAFAEAVIASTKSFYLVPIFEQLDRPITDTVVMPGIAEFAQPDLFTELDYNEIRAACPPWRSYECEGILNGWNMNGWIWADFSIMHSVFNTYGVVPPLPAGFVSSSSGGINSTWAPAFIADAWRVTEDNGGVTSYRDVRGWIRDLNASNAGHVAQMRDGDTPVAPDVARTNSTFVRTTKLPTLGAWFYRPLPP